MKVNVRIGGLILLVSLCLVWIFSCGKDDIILDGFTHTISGTVYDSVTLSPVDSALVTWVTRWMFLQFKPTPTAFTRLRCPWPAQAFFSVNKVTIPECAGLMTFGQTFLMYLLLRIFQC